MNLENYTFIIENMVNQKDQELDIDKLENIRERHIRLTGILSDYFRENDLGTIIVTGGLTVEYYTNGGYMTQDIDLITMNQRKLEEFAQQLGFERDGKYLIHEKLEIVIEIVADEPFNGAYKPPKTVVTQDGFEVEFVDVNDIIMDRIRGLIHWDTKEYDRWIFLLIQQYVDEIDIEYITRNLTEQENSIFVDYVEIVNHPDSYQARIRKFKEYLETKEVHYTEHEQSTNIKYFAFPLTKQSREDLGMYFGLLILPKFDILLYNEDEEFEMQQVKDVYQVLREYGEQYGFPFCEIADGLLREVIR